MYVFLSPPVLPLTPENVAGVFVVVPLTKTVRLSHLGSDLGIPEEYHHQPQTAARWYVNEGEDCSWRRIAYCLDSVNETGVSDYIIPYVEPPAGVYTVHEHLLSSGRMHRRVTIVVYVCVLITSGVSVHPVLTQQAMEVTNFVGFFLKPLGFFPPVEGHAVQLAVFLRICIICGGAGALHFSAFI